MKPFIMFVSVVFAALFLSCTGPEGAPGRDAPLNEVFELRSVNFGYSAANGFSIYQSLSPNIYASDVVLIYRMTGTIDANTPIWQLIPRTLFLPQGELDYDFDFSKEDFTIYAGGNFDLNLAPSYINNQTFRIVIVPGAFSNKKTPDFYADYNAVIKAYGIDDRHVKLLNK